MQGEWRRTHEAYGREEALDAVSGGTAWVFLWCRGDVSRSGDKSGATAVEYARRHLIEPAERERRFAKAQRKGRTKTVVMAEQWEDEHGRPLVVFYETGPYLLPARTQPDRI